MKKQKILHSKSTISELTQQDFNELINEVLALEKTLTIQPTSS